MIPHRRWGWILFFAVLLLLAATAVTIEILFNLGQQLTSGRVEQARTLWQEKGPPDYDLTYTLIRQDPEGEHLRAEVQDDAVPTLFVNDQPLDPVLYPFHDLLPLLQEMQPAAGDAPAPKSREIGATAPANGQVVVRVEVRGGRVERVRCNDRVLPAALARTYDMAGLLGGLGRFVQSDAGSGNRPYSVANFDRADGHLTRYVHSSMRSRQRVEVNVVELQRR